MGGGADKGQDQGPDPPRGHRSAYSDGPHERDLFLRRVALRVQQEGYEGRGFHPLLRIDGQGPHDEHEGRAGVELLRGLIYAGDRAPLQGRGAVDDRPPTLRQRHIRSGAVLICRQAERRALRYEGIRGERAHPPLRDRGRSQPEGASRGPRDGGCLRSLKVRSQRPQRRDRAPVRFRGAAQVLRKGK